MTLEELDKKAGELFRLIDEAAKASDPRYKEDHQIIYTLAVLGVEFLADHKKMLQQFELINKALTVMVDLQAASYQNGIIVKIANELQIDTEGLSEGFAKAFGEQEGGGQENEGGSYIEEETAEAAEKAAYHDSLGHRDNRPD